MNDVVFGFILGLIFAATCLLLIKWMETRTNCWDPNNKYLPSFEERIQRIKKSENELMVKK